jgi:3-oxoacyl-[acyl-carrier-protein] synthase-3
MQDGSHQHVLVVGGEIISHRIDYQDRATCVLFGDGAGAVVLDYSNRPEEGEILSLEIHSDGNLWGLLNVPGGGSRNPISIPMIEAGLHYIKMQGNEVFKHAVRCMRDAARKAMKSSGISVHQIDWFIPHQANIRIMEAVAKQCDIPMDKVIVTVHKYGNTSVGTIPTALDEVVRSGQIRKGDLVLASSFGAGFTWGAVLFRF